MYFDWSFQRLRADDFQPCLKIAHLSAGGTFLVARAQRRGDTVRAKSMQTLFGRHCVAQHVEADGTHEKRVQGFALHLNFRVVQNQLLRFAIELVAGEFKLLLRHLSRAVSRPFSRPFPNRLLSEHWQT